VADRGSPKTIYENNKNTGNRIRYRKVDAETGDEVDSSEIIKGYEVGKGQVEPWRLASTDRLWEMKDLVEMLEAFEASQNRAA
jgi:hypothetical protein